MLGICLKQLHKRYSSDRFNEQLISFLCIRENTCSVLVLCAGMAKNSAFRRAPLNSGHRYWQPIYKFRRRTSNIQLPSHTRAKNGCWVFRASVNKYLRFVILKLNIFLFNSRNYLSIVLKSRYRLQKMASQTGSYDGYLIIELNIEFEPD